MSGVLRNAKAGRLSGTIVCKALLAGSALLGLVAQPARAVDWRADFIDPEDGYLDVSGLLSRGGFIPVPIIITEPAVEGGLGVAGQFIHPSATPGGTPGRTIIGGAYTGNGSWGGGLLQQGALADDQLALSFRLGLCRHDVADFPVWRRHRGRLRQQNEIRFRRISDTSSRIRRSRSGRDSSTEPPDVSLETQGPLADRVNTLIDRFTGEHQYVAAGLSTELRHSRQPDFAHAGHKCHCSHTTSIPRLSEATGNSTQAQLYIHAFQKLGDAWSIGAKLGVDSVSEDAPFFMAPAVDLRGVESGRYQGDTALSYRGRAASSVHAPLGGSGVRWLRADLCGQHAALRAHERYLDLRSRH